MAKTEMIRARIEPKLKKRVEGMLAAAGLTHGDFVGMMYRQAYEHGELPIEIKLKPAFRQWLDSLPVSKNAPNASLRRTLRQPRSGKGLKRYRNFQELRDELGI